MQDWKPSVPETRPAAEMPDSHAESLQPSPHDMPALDTQTSTDPVSSLLSVPGPPQDLPSAPVHSMPQSQGAGPVGAMPSATLEHDALGSAHQQSPMQQLQAALSAQSQVNDISSLTGSCCCLLRLPVLQSYLGQTKWIISWRDREWDSFNRCLSQRHVAGTVVIIVLLCCAVLCKLRRTVQGVPGYVVLCHALLC